MHVSFWLPWFLFLFVVSCSFSSAHRPGMLCWAIRHNGLRVLIGHASQTARQNGTMTVSTRCRSRAVKMRREAQATLYKKAFGYAGYSANGQVTHRPRHDGAVTGRLQLDASTQSPGDMGDWQQTVLTGVYARLPGGTDLAKFAGFGSRDHYMVVEGLLDPSLMPESKGMVQALCEDLPELLEEHRQARHGCCTPCWSLQ